MCKRFDCLNSNVNVWLVTAVTTDTTSTVVLRNFNANRKSGFLAALPHCELVVRNSRAFPESALYFFYVLFCLCAEERFSCVLVYLCTFSIELSKDVPITCTTLSLCLFITSSSLYVFFVLVFMFFNTLSFTEEVLVLATVSCRFYCFVVLSFCSFLIPARFLS